MKDLPVVHYQEKDFRVGWLEEYPGYRTQGVTLEELKRKPQRYLGRPEFRTNTIRA
jgi:hypothetical protein